MPGFEVFGKEEREAINRLFELNGGVLFAHGFDAMRKGIYRVREFESAFAKHFGVPYAQAVSSGSAALKVAMKALGIGAGDEVITQSFTFVATVEAIIEVGAIPVISDIDKTLNIDPQSLEKAITPKTKAVIPVHMMGAPARMDEVMAIAKKHKLLVLEDNAQGAGGKYKGLPLGSIGDIGTFSFDFGKTMTTGEGGMVVTSSKDLYIKARAYHDHGHEYSSLPRGIESALMRGFNYRMTEIQGAIGIAQLQKLNMIVEKQKRNKKQIKDGIGDIPFEFREIVDEEGEIGDTIVFFLESPEQAKRFEARLRDEGLGTKNLPDAIRWHFSGRWEQMFKDHPIYKNSWQSQWENSADLLNRSIALPVMVNMTDEKILEVIDTVRRISKEV